jgi:hypothetical protein
MQILQEQISVHAVFQQERELGAVATHCFYCVEKLCRYLCSKGQRPYFGENEIPAEISTRYYHAFAECDVVQLHGRA